MVLDMCSLHGWIIIITRNRLSFGGFHKWVPQNQWFIMEHPMKIHDLGVITHILGTLHILIFFPIKSDRCQATQGIKLIPNLFLKCNSKIRGLIIFLVKKAN
jgi:hypothetical protein